MGELIRAHPWSTTPLSSPQYWPPELKTLVTLVLASGQPMFIAWGAERTLIYNDAYIPLLGGKHPGLGQPFFDTWAEAEDDLRPLDTEVFAGRAVHSDDILLMLDRGQGEREAHFAYSYTPIWSEGAVVGLLGACKETTQAVLLREAKEQDHERLAQMFDQAPSFMALLSGPSHRIVLVNTAYKNLVGDRELLGRTVEEALPDAVEQGYLDLLNQVFQSGAAYRSTGAQFDVRAAGERAVNHRFVDFIYQPIKDSKGQVTGIFVEGSDTTDRTFAENALRALNETLEQRVADRTAELRLVANIVETTDVMIMVCDLNYNILAINKANADEFERLYGVRPKVGDNMLALLADQPEHQLQVRAGWGRGMSGEEVTFVEDYGDPNRTRPYYEVKFRTLWNEHGVRVGCYQFVTDVSERLKKQAMLAEAQEALRQAQKMEAVGQLTGGLAHDFNNMLTGITGSLEVIRSRIRQGRLDEVERFLNEAEAAAGRAAALTHRLLAFSRRQTLDPKPTDVGRLISDMEDLIGRTMGPAVEISFTRVVGLWTTLVDPNQLESAVLNLCINARDAMPDGGRLTIDVANRSLSGAADTILAMPAGDYVTLSVLDVGTGMTKEVMARAFEPFFTTKPLGQGTGLGLSMVHGFALQSRGQVQIESEVGSGTGVHLYLPRHHTVPNAAPSVQPVANAAPILRGHTILIVDDELAIRMLVRTALEDAGYVCAEASGGSEGLRVLSSGRQIDLLVTDIGMPGGMNGREMASRARRRRPDLKVLFITGYADHTAISDNQLAPGMTVLLKPFPLQELVDRVGHLLSSKF